MNRATHRSIMKQAETGNITAVYVDQLIEGKKYIGRAFGLFTIENGQVFFESPINGAVYTIDPVHNAPFYEYDKCLLAKSLTLANVSKTANTCER